MATQIETSEHEIVLVEHARIRPDDEPDVLGSSAHRRIPYTLVDPFILVYEAVSYRSLPGRRALIGSTLVDRPQQEL
ncbi:MAG TPA: hypothetical protein VGA48_04530 [Thermoplasmata archaeon]